jgi:hypothetical protein
MADFENRHPGARQRDEIALDLFEDGDGEDCRAGGEIMNTMNGCRHRILLQKHALSTTEDAEEQSRLLCFRGADRPVQSFVTSPPPRT